MAEEKTVEQQLKEMMVERLMLTVSPEEIGDDEPLMEAYDIDSIRLFEIIIGIEEAFDLSFEDEEFEVDTFQNVKAIADKVRAKQAVEQEGNEEAEEQEESAE